MSSSKAGFLLAILLIIASIFAVHSSLRVPAVAAADSPAEEFSAARALEHLKVIAVEPHPTGTAAQAAVRSYIVGQIEALGLNATLQEEVGVSQNRIGLIYASDVTNILVRIEGSAGGDKAVLFLCHYDSVPNGPGASDDGVAVAAFLETLRALGSGPQPSNDLMFLFTDGEEAGLLGAQAFVQKHPQASDVGLVVNFEARGTAGPSLMFETSEGNHALIKALRRGVAGPVASSYSFEVYKAMPNDSDFTIFRRAGVPGMNFGFIHGPSAYHTAMDSVQRLDPSSLQHHGEVALGLARHLGAADLTQSWSGRNSTYFNLPGGFFISYPGVLEIPLALLALILSVALLVQGAKKGKVRPAPVIAAIFFHLLGPFILGIAAFIALRLATVGVPILGPLGPYSFSVWGGHSSISLHLVAMSLLLAGLGIWIFRVGRKILTLNHFFAGALILWAGLSLAVTLVAGGAGYLFSLPTLLACGVAHLWFKRSTEDERVGTPLMLAASLVLVLLVFLWAPPLALLGVALSVNAAAVIGGLMWLLLGGLLAPQMELLRQSRAGKILPLALLVSALALVLALRAASTFGPENPRLNSILYAMNTTKGIASWFSLDPETDAWTRQFLGDSPQRMALPTYIGSPRPVLQAEAPTISREGATVQLVGKTPLEGGGNLLDLRISWPYAVHRARIYLASASDIRALRFAGQRLERKGNLGPSSLPYKTIVIYQGIAAQSVAVQVELAGSDPLQVEVAGQIYGLPTLAFLPYEPRPAELMPSQLWESDSTIIRSLSSIHPASFVEDGVGEDEGEDEAAENAV